MKKLAWMLLFIPCVSLPCDMDEMFNRIVERESYLVSKGILKLEHLDLYTELYRMALEEHKLNLDMDDDELTEHSNKWICNIFENSLVSMDIIEREYWIKRQM